MQQSLWQTSQTPRVPPNYWPRLPCETWLAQKIWVRSWWTGKDLAHKCRLVTVNAALTICTQMLQVTYWEALSRKLHSNAAGNHWKRCTHNRHSDDAENLLRILHSCNLHSHTAGNLLKMLHSQSVRRWCRKLTKNTALIQSAFTYCR